MHLYLISSDTTRADGDLAGWPEPQQATGGAVPRWARALGCDAEPRAVGAAAARAAGYSAADVSTARYVDLLATLVTALAAFARSPTDAEVDAAVESTLATALPASRDLMPWDGDAGALVLSWCAAAGLAGRSVPVHALGVAASVAEIAYHLLGDALADVAEFLIALPVCPPGGDGTIIG